MLTLVSTVAMSEDALIRLENLRRLNKSAKELELLVGGRYTYWHDMLAGTKSFGEKAARKIEDKLGLQRGQMDQEHGISAAAITLPSMTVQATGTPAPVLVITDQCRDIMAMLATLPNDPEIRYKVMHEIMQVIKQARDSPGAHQEPPAYKHAATRSG